MAGSAVWAKPAKGQFLMGDEISFGKFPPLGRPGGGGSFPTEFNVGDMSASRAMEMTVFVQIGTETGRLPVDMNRLDQTAPDHRLQTVINRGKGDRGHPLLGTDKNLRGRWMIPFLHQHFVDMTSLGSQTQSIPPHHTLIRSGLLLLH